MALLRCFVFTGLLIVIYPNRHSVVTTSFWCLVAVETTLKFNLLNKKPLNSVTIVIIIRSRSSSGRRNSSCSSNSNICSSGSSNDCIISIIYVLTFSPVPLSSLSPSFISCTVSTISFLSCSWRRHKMTHKGWRVMSLNPNTINQQPQPPHHHHHHYQ